MSRESEKAFKAMHEFLNANARDDMDEDEMNELIQDFMEKYNSDRPGLVTEKTAKTADDFLELAEDAASEVKAKKYGVSGITCGNTLVSQ